MENLSQIINSPIKFQEFAQLVKEADWPIDGVGGWQSVFSLLFFSPFFQVSDDSIQGKSHHCGSVIWPNHKVVFVQTTESTLLSA
jgi:hypothetical protein